MAAHTSLLYHMVFSTKHHVPLISESLEAELYPYIGGILRNHRCALLEIGGMPDHVHLAVSLRPDIEVAQAVGFIKANSSKWINAERPVRGKFHWQTKYAAFTVSKSDLPAVCEYIRNQKEHHPTKSFQEELRELLRAHGIEFDERYMWD